MMLYLSRKVGWLLAIIFGIVAISLYSSPGTSRPFIGAAVSLGDTVTNNLLNVIKHMLT
jgi:hypothetical protein